MPSGSGSLVDSSRRRPWRINDDDNEADGSAALDAAVVVVVVVVETVDAVSSRLPGGAEVVSLRRCCFSWMSDSVIPLAES